MIENIGVLNILLPSALLALALVLTLVYLFKRRSFEQTEIRHCPHCKSVIDDNQAICGNCHRKIIFV